MKVSELITKLRIFDDNLYVSCIATNFFWSDKQNAFVSSDVTAGFKYEKIGQIIVDAEAGILQISAGSIDSTDKKVIDDLTVVAFIAYLETLDPNLDVYFLNFEEENVEIRSIGQWQESPDSIIVILAR